MKLSRKTLSILLTIIALVAVFVCAKVFADTNSNASGYLWSSNIGWIKLNDCDDPGNASTCTGGSYGVNIPNTNGTITGYAWSPNIGWITFGDPSCPTSGCTPGARVAWKSDGTATISGWARACSVYVANCSGTLTDAAYTGTWDGYIALDSNTGGGTGGAWGLSIDANKSITGYAWGSEVMGWINSINASIYSGLTVQLTASPTSISAGGSSTLTIIASTIDNASACSIDKGVGAVPMHQSGSGWTGTVSVSPANTTAYTASCIKSGKTATDTATVTVSYFVSPASPGGGGNGSGYDDGSGGYCAITNPQFAWDSAAASCTLTKDGGASISVPGSSQAAGGSLGTDGRYYYTPNLPVGEGSTGYTLQCGSLTLHQSVNSCRKDYLLSATPATAGSNTLTPAAGGKMQATYTVAVVPQAGFTSPVTLSISSKPANLPKSAVFTFATQTLTFNGSSYATTLLTVTINTTDLKKTTTYTPVIVQGFGGNLIRTAQVSIGSDVKLQPVFNEF
ncbi:MAG: hypothetical protein JWL92_246 [Candidatus Nomurabacteria bacterium]|nr:hypothetical protein [Candidatus Nomurabacteria bacterium]